MALPVATIALVLITSLTIALAALTRTEPLIAGNHHRVAQARALADSGIERIVWALNATGAVTGGLDAPTMGGTPPAPYDGSRFVRLGTIGGFTMRVTGLTSSEVQVDVNGWHPTNDEASPVTKARRHVLASVFRITPVWERLACALCARGPLDVDGSIEVDGRPSASPGNDACGPKLGMATYHSAGSTTIRNGARVWGAPDGNATENEASDVAERLDPSAFDEGTLTDADLDRLRDLARSNGTYFGPGFAGGGTAHDPASHWTGAITFGPGRQLRSGVVFVDTVSGRNPSAGAETADLADVRLDGAFWANPDPARGAVESFEGWIIINGTVRVSGGVSVKGLLYTANAVVLSSDAGVTRVDGQVISRNVRDTDPRTALDAGRDGSVRLAFDCNAVRRAPGLATTWTLKPGTYREVSD